MLRGEGGGAWDIVCGDDKGDVFESMVLKVLKERHDAEYYVNFLTNMIGLQHGIAGLAHVCLSPGTLGLAIRAAVLIDSSNESDPSSDTTATLTPQINQVVHALLFRSAGSEVLARCRDSDVLKYFGRQFTNSKGSDGNLLPRGRIGAIGCLFASHPGARAYFPTIPLWGETLVEVANDSNSSVKDIIAAGYLIYHLPGVDSGGRSLWDQIDFLHVLRQCFSVISPSNTTSSSTPLILRLQAVDVVSFALQDSAHSESIEEWGEELFSHLKNNSENIKACAETIRASNGDKKDAKVCKELITQLQPSAEVLAAFLAHGSLAVREKTLELLTTVGFFQASFAWTVLSWADATGRLLCSNIFNSILSILTSGKAKIPDPQTLSILEARSCDQRRPVALGPINFLKSAGSKQQLAACREHLRAAMLQYRCESLELIDIQVQRFACILLTDDWKENEDVKEYLKLLSNDGRAISILRYALLSHEPSTIDTALQLVTLFFNASQNDIPEAACFVDAWSTNNRDAHAVSAKAEREQKEAVSQKAAEAQAKQKEMEGMEKRFQLKSRNFEHRMQDLKDSYDDQIKQLEAGHKAQEDQVDARLRATQEQLDHAQSLLHMKEISVNRVSEQMEVLRSERDIAERDSAVLRRKLNALEERVTEIAKQLLDALQSGAKEVAEREKRIILLTSSHENKLKALEKDRHNIREHFENEVSRLETEVEHQNSKLSELRDALKNANIADTKRAENDQDLMNQLVKRLSKMIRVYEQKDSDCNALKKQLVSIKYS